MDAVVLVGGFGTRLRPLTLTIPKQMLPVAGPTMLERVVGHLAEHGVTRVVLALGYRPDIFTAAYPEGTCLGVEMVYAVESEPLDTAGAVAFAAREAGVAETFVVVNGDVISDLDITELIAFHRERRAEGTIHLTPVDDPSRYGVVPIDDHGRVLAFIEKPAPGEAPTNWINGGTYVLEPSVIDRVAPGRPVSIEREVFPAMVADGTLYALERAGRWVDAGTPATYLQVNLDHLVDGQAVVTAGAEVDPSASVECCWIGPRARIDAGAVLRDSVVLAGARVGAEAKVSCSIIGPAAVVGAGAEVDDLSVIGEGAVVERGAVLRGARLPSGEP